MLDDGSSEPTRRRPTADEPSPPSVFLDVPGMTREGTESPGIRMGMPFSDPASGMWAGPGSATIFGAILEPNVFADGRKPFSPDRGAGRG